jgi:NAD(P)-dependent dehydrogenase (short-subunit alcohol dehydrogenase family)
LSDLRIGEPAQGGRLTTLRRLDRWVALVTGGGSGAGAAIARRCADLGASVVIADIDYALAGEVAAGIRGAGGAALAHRCDVAVEEQVAAMVDRAMREFGSLDVVVNNAGPWLDDDPEEHWARIVGANLMGTLHVTRASLAALRRRGGAIVNVAAGSGLGFGEGNQPAYSAAKAGIMRFTASLRGLKAEHGIRVNCIVPDVIDSADSFAVSVLELALREDCAGRIVLYRDGTAREVVEYGDPGYRRVEPW